MKESADEELQRVKHQLAALEQWLERTSLEQATKLEQLLQEHTRTEAALAHERNLLRTLIDNLPDYIYAKDAEGRFLIANAALARRMGAARAEELLGRTDSDYYPRDVAARYAEDEGEVEATKAHDRRLPLAWTFTPDGSASPALDCTWCSRPGRTAAIRVRSSTQPCAAVSTSSNCETKSSTRRR